eukprot:4439208-Pyramimonas_sp.AAC.1
MMFKRLRRASCNKTNSAERALMTAGLQKNYLAATGLIHLVSARSWVGGLHSITKAHWPPTAPTEIIPVRPYLGVGATRKAELVATVKLS